MFSKIRKGKGKDEEEESPSEWDTVTTEATKQQPQDPLKSNNGNEGNSPERAATVEIDLNEGEYKTEVPSIQPANWRQNLVKKLRPKNHGSGKPPKTLQGLQQQGSGPVGMGGGPGHPPSKKGCKLPGFFDFTPPPQTLRLEYKFDEWNGDHLNPEYQDPPRVLSSASYKAQSVGHKYWGETFAAIQPIADFVIALFLELLAFAARISGRLLTGTLLRLTDLLIKPLLVFTFNALVFPPLVFLMNVLRALSQCTIPLFEICKRQVEVLAIPIRACRLVEIKYVYPPANQPVATVESPQKKPMMEEV